MELGFGKEDKECNDYKKLLEAVARTHNKSIGKSWADGSCVVSFLTLCSSCSGLTSNFRLIANQQLLFLFSSSVSAAGRNSISQPSQISGR